MSSQNSSKLPRTSSQRTTGNGNAEAPTDATATKPSHGRNKSVERQHVSPGAAGGAQDRASIPGNDDQNVEHAREAKTAHPSTTRDKQHSTADNPLAHGMPGAPRGTSGDAMPEKDRVGEDQNRGKGKTTEVPEQTMDEIIKRFDHNVALVFEGFDTVAESIEETRKKAVAREAKNSSDLLAKLKAQREALIGIVDETRAEIGKVAKGKYVTSDLPGMTAARGSTKTSEEREDALRAELRKRSRRVTIEEVTDEEADVGHPSLPRRETTRTERPQRGRQATVEDASDDEADAGTPPLPRRDAPPHLHGPTHDERLRKSHVRTSLDQPVVVPPGLSRSMPSSDARVAEEGGYDNSRAWARPANRTSRREDDEPQSISQYLAREDVSQPREVVLTAPGHATPRGDASTGQYLPYTTSALRSAYGVTATAASAAASNPFAVDPSLEPLLKRMTDHLEHMVGEARSGTALKTGAKASLPEAYDGRNDHDAFNTWINGLASYLRMYYLCGPDYDEDRMLHAGNALSGEAREWWTEKVLGPHYRREYSWTFIDAVRALYIRFVREGSSRKAAHRFQHTTYSKQKGGANGLLNRLEKYAARMVVRPDEYTMARRFYDSLPSELAATVTKIHQVRPENSNAATLLFWAQKIEDDEDYIARRERDSTRSAPTASATARGSAPRAGPSGNGRRDDRAPRRDRPTDSRPSAAPARPRDNARVSTAARDQGQARPRDASRIQCYKCKGFGHYSGDSSCPLFVKPSLRRMEADEEAEDHPIDGEIQDHTPVTDDQAHLMVLRTDDDYPAPDCESGSEYLGAGSQYDSDLSYERASDFDTESTSSDDERVYAIRVVSEDLPALVPLTRAAVATLPDAGPAVSAGGTGDPDDLPSLHTVSDSSVEDDDVGARSEYSASDYSDRAVPPVDDAAEHTVEVSEGAAPVTVTPDDDGSDTALPVVTDGARLYAALASMYAELSAGELVDRVRTIIEGYHQEAVSLLEENGRLNRLLDEACARADELRAELAAASGGVLGYRPTPPTASPSAHSQLSNLRTELAHRAMEAARQATTISALRAEMLLLERAFRHDVDFATIQQVSRNVARRDALRQRLEDLGGAVVGADPAADLPLSPFDNDLAHVNARIRALTGFDFADDEGVTGPLDPIGAMLPESLDTATPRAPLHDVTNARMFAMREDDPRVYRTAMRTTGSAQQRPPSAAKCMTIHVTINGLKALALIDTGSTINCVSPDFARVAKIPVFELTNPVGLQLGCVGSRSRINYGTRALVDVGGRREETYFDIVNVDHYDVILGIPYMIATGLLVDFARYAIRMGGSVIPALRGEGPSNNDSQRRRGQSVPPKASTTQAVRHTRSASA
ncbi:hypothetical protein PsYK624_081890 [Phanerochaete sordida]|uniref:Uncharacterized protein n=1 Tax=Phanerochaete sordida TaxID=48140 RepID=A0A9P3LE07_9APHY|nr:hypothetical protein PsYK624_081890 [Phanerochaete sordida]